MSAQSVAKLTVRSTDVGDFADVTRPHLAHTRFAGARRGAYGVKGTLMAPLPRLLPQGPPPRGSVRLTLLDGFALSCDDVAVPVSRTSQRLLAILGLRPAATRSHLAGLLWPETPEERAVASLRTALWRLRKQAAPLVRAHGETVRLDEGVHVDVAELVRSARQVQAGDEAADAATLLTSGPGELLPGWYDDWVLVERERLRQLRLQTLEALAQHQLRLHRYGAALEAAMAAMRAEPLRETPHRLVLAVHLAQGNSAEALTAYRRYRDLLSRELGLAPSPALQRLLRDSLAPLALVPAARTAPHDAGVTRPAL